MASGLVVNRSGSDPINRRNSIPIIGISGRKSAPLLLSVGGIVPHISGRNSAPRAGYKLAKGHIWPSGRSLETPALDAELMQYVQRGEVGEKQFELFLQYLFFS